MRKKVEGRTKRIKLKIVRCYLWKIVTSMPNLLYQFKMTPLHSINYVGKLHRYHSLPQANALHNGLSDIHSSVAVKLAYYNCYLSLFCCHTLALEVLYFLDVTESLISLVC